MSSYLSTSGLARISARHPWRVIGAWLVVLVLLVLVFQEGYTADLFGYQEVEAIEAWLPLFLFSILFGLSMDYHVFLLSRIKEHWDLSHRNAESVAVGLQATARIITGAARIITGAALIIVAVFAGFAAGRLTFLQQTGLGLGVAVLIDATIVRSILVPSAMALLGKWNWYLPSWLGWLPNPQIEAPHPAPAPAPVLKRREATTDRAPAQCDRPSPVASTAGRRGLAACRSTRWRSGPRSLTPRDAAPAALPARSVAGALAPSGSGGRRRSRSPSRWRNRGRTRRGASGRDAGPLPRS